MSGQFCFLWWVVCIIFLPSGGRLTMFQRQPRLIVRGRFRFICIMTSFLGRQDSNIIMNSNTFTGIFGTIYSFTILRWLIRIFNGRANILEGPFCRFRVLNIRPLDNFHQRRLLCLICIIGRDALVANDCKGSIVRT